MAAHLLIGTLSMIRAKFVSHNLSIINIWCLNIVTDALYALQIDILLISMEYRQPLIAVPFNCTRGLCWENAIKNN